jgi:hypothetical protein
MPHSYVRSVLELEMKQETTNALDTPRTQPAEEQAVPKCKRPYVAPVLKRLGSVRELTLATTGSKPDGRINHHQVS